MSDPNKKVHVDWKTKIEAEEAARQAAKEQKNAEFLKKLHSLSRQEKENLIKNMRGDPDIAWQIRQRIKAIPETMIDPEVKDLIAEIKAAAESTLEIDDAKQADLKRKGRPPFVHYPRPSDYKEKQ